MELTSQRNTTRIAWFVLLFNIFVVVFGGVVRATGSGAGCGSHWPLCNGVVVPQDPALETIIEFTHRISSGLSILFIIWLGIRIWRGYSAHHPARKSMLAVVVFIITESLIGAGLVLFGLVVHNDSLARVFAMMAHLLNTMFLLGAIAITAWLSELPEAIQKNKRNDFPWFPFLMAGFAFVLLILSGAIAALGDSIFPSESLIEGIRADFDQTAHLLIRLRIYHPLIAILAGGGVAWFVLRSAKPTGWQHQSVVRMALVAMFLVQLAIGLVNVWLLAPVWLQMVHLFVTSVVWILFVSLAIFHWIPRDPFAGISQEQVDQGIH